MRFKILTILLLFIYPTLPTSADELRLGAFLPTEVGRQWTYEVVKERKYVLPDGRETVQTFHGTTTERIAGPSQAVDYAGPDGKPVPVLVMEQQIREQDASTGQTREAKSNTHISVEPGQIMVHAQGVESAELSTEGELHRFDPPFALLKLPLPKEGEPFPSQLSMQGMTFDMRPYAQSRETVEVPAGTFENCLRVDSRGPITGSVPGPQGALEIQGGGYEGSVWYAEGVGIVKETQTLTMEIEIAPGQKLRSVEEKVKTLKETGKG